MNEKLEKNLKNHKESNGVLISIKALSNEYFRGIDEFSEEKQAEILKTKMAELLDGFLRYELVSTKNLKSSIEGINTALVGKKERELYELIDRQDEIQRRIKQKQDEIRVSLKLSFESAENLINSSDISCKDEVLALLNNAIMRETRMLWILKESSQNAFLTTIENGININETIAQIAKNMTYTSIVEGEFNKARILEISKTIINSAAEVANEGHIFAKELIDGAVLGTKDGITSAITRLKDEAKFAPDEAKLTHEVNELKDIDKSFINMLKELETSLKAPAKDEIKMLLDTTLNSGAAKLKRISEQASEQIAERLNEIRQNPSVAELINSTNEKLEKLKSAINSQSEKLNVNEKIENIKHELEELEKKATEKFGEVKSINLKEEAKKMGDRAYKAAKDFLGNFKKDEK